MFGYNFYSRFFLFIYQMHFEYIGMFAFIYVDIKHDIKQDLVYWTMLKFIILMILRIKCSRVSRIHTFSDAVSTKVLSTKSHLQIWNCWHRWRYIQHKLLLVWSIFVLHPSIAWNRFCLYSGLYRDVFVFWYL